ncbi:MAG TPA: autotransporter domain-containing protein, partial [Allosphingosinicella sp.]|nr:autotransporter domain-containing protein [Allosphingosinicella sp.]
EEATGILAVSGAEKYEGGAVTVTSGTVGTTGDSAEGIHAEGESVVVVSGTVSTTGDDSAGIYVRSTAFDPPIDDGGKYGGETITIAAVGPNGASVTSGSVTTTGDNSPGIEAHSDLGDVEVISTGTVTTSGESSYGILAVSQTGAVTVDSNNLNVTGPDSAGIAVGAATSSTIIIRGLNRSAQDFTIFALGGPVTVNILAGGTVRGRVGLSNEADTIDNAGRFDAIGTSDFRGGTDVFNNNAGGIVSSFNGAASLTGLETFNNRSRVDLRDGAAGDTLNISGLYNGLGGSRLGVDVNFADELADVLILGQATGTTAIDVAVVGVSGILADPILLVDASAGTGSGAFTLAGGSVSNGFVRTSLIFDAPNFNFLLATSPEQPVFETAKIGQIGTNIWYLGADALSAQLEGARDGGMAGAGGGSALAQESASGDTRRGFGFWVQGVLGDSEIDGVQQFGTTVFDVSYEQDYLGVQGGLDYSTGRARLGITFGGGNADSTFLASGNTLDVDDKNVGAYVAVNSKGGFFFNALAKMDWLKLKANPGPGLQTEFDGRAFGFMAEGGVRFGLGNLFAEPSVGISWVNTDFDDIVSGPAAIAVEDVRSMRARAALRIGGDIAMGSGTLSPFAGVQVFEELEGENSTSFVLGQTLTLVDEPPGSRAVFNLGTSFRAGAFEAFVRGDLDFGDQDGKSIRAGIRLRF